MDTGTATDSAPGQHITIPYGVRNEETKDHPDIFVGRGFKTSWPEFWEKFSALRLAIGRFSARMSDE